MNIIRATATVGGLTGISRLLGFVRDLLIAAFLGAGAAADAFFVAFKLANLLRRLFAEGAFNAAFVPLFSRALAGEGREEARRFADEAAAIMGLILLGTVVLAQLFMPTLVRVLASGFEVGGERYELAVELSRITFPYLAFISLAALVSGVLNSLGKFGAAAFAPILLNLTLISAIIVASMASASIPHGLAWGVALAGVVQLAWVCGAAARSGFAIRFTRPRLSPKITRLFALMGPGVVGAGVYQINLVVDTWFASHLEEGAVSWLFYADRLVQLPLGIVGIAIGTAILPALSRQLREGRPKDAISTVNRGIELGIFLTLPAAVALGVIALPIVTVLFERGAFGASDSVATAWALTAFAFGLPAYLLIKVAAPAYFAREDTRTPVLVAAACLFANVLMISLLIDDFGHVGIAFATACANWLNAAILMTLLVRAGRFEIDERLKKSLPRIVVAASIMGILLWLAAQQFDGIGVAELAALLAIGSVCYLTVAHGLGAVDLREIKKELRSAA